MKRIRYYFIIGLLLLCSNLGAQQSKELVFLSDTQAPIWVETILLPPYKNIEATDSLFNDIIMKKPLALFLLGDLVGVGSDIYLWKDIDDNLIRINEKNISVYSIPGNHEYMFSGWHGINNYNKRFPESSNYGYVTIQDSIAVIMLNSNFSKLSKRENKMQLDFLKNSLTIFDTAASIKNVIVACHHSPYTNSKVVESSRKVQDLFVDPYLRSKKASLFISGHSHNLEMFSKQNKNFLVIGGGGGIKQPTWPLGTRKWKDKIDDSIKPLYFYIIVKREDNKLKVTARGIKKDFKFFELLLVQ